MGILSTFTKTKTLSQYYYSYFSAFGDFRSYILCNFYENIFIISKGHLNLELQEKLVDVSFEAIDVFCIQHLDM